MGVAVESTEDLDTNDSALRRRCFSDLSSRMKRPELCFLGVLWGVDRLEAGRSDLGRVSTT